jgi:hypothetical protein
MQHRALSLCATCILATVTGTANAGYVFQDIVDPLNPTFTQALGINNAGTVVGYGNATVFNGFQLNGGTFTRQNFPSADGGTQVIGNSGAGATVGFYVTGGTTNGYAQFGGTFTTVDQPATAFNQLLGINRSGTTAAGYSSTDAAGATLQRALIASGGPQFSAPTFTDINALLPANSNSQATGVNDAGTVVGFYQDAAGNFTGFVDVLGAINSILFPSSISTQVLGINDLGDIVGDYVDAANVMHGFLYTAGTYTTLDPSGSGGTTANGINDLGQIVGFYALGDNTVGFLAQQAVAEPATPLLAGLALAALAWTTRRARMPSARTARD